MENRKISKIEKFVRKNTLGVGLAGIVSLATLTSLTNVSCKQRELNYVLPEVPTSKYSNFTNYIEHVAKWGENPSKLIQNYSGLPAGEIFKYATKRAWHEDNGIEFGETLPENTLVKIRIPDSKSN